MIEMFPRENIKVTADGDKSELQWRYARLNRVIGNAVSRLPNWKIACDFMEKIARVHDHEGELTVTWKSQPMDYEKQAFVNAWCDSVVGDGGDVDSVVHEVG